VFLPALILVRAEKLTKTAEPHAAYDVFKDIVCRFFLIDVWGALRFIVIFRGSHAMGFGKTGAIQNP